MNTIHTKVIQLICFLFLIIIRTPIYGMNNTKDYFDDIHYSNFEQDCDDLELTFRDIIFEELPLGKNVIHGIDEEHLFAFKKRFIKDNGFKIIFHDNYEQTLDYLRNIWKTSEIAQKVDVVTSTIERYTSLNLPQEEIKSLLQEYFIELYLQKFYSPKLDCLLRSCSCPKAPLTSKLLCMLSAINNLSLVFPPEQCSESSPLISTFFGSGNLMNEYLFLHILVKRGYCFTSSHYIDPIYKDAEYTDIFNAQNEQLLRNDCIAQISIFDSTKIFKKFMEINQLKHHLIISIDPGDIRKIKDKKAHKHAHLAYVVLKNSVFNQQHCIKMNLKNLKSIKVDQTANNNGGYTVYTQTMNMQIKKLDKKLTHHFISKQHESREAFVVGLQGFVASKKEKIQKKPSQNYFNLIDVEWFRDPSMDFEDLIKPYVRSSTACLMVHNGMQELTAS